MEGFKNLGLPGQVIVTLLLMGAIIGGCYKWVWPKLEKQGQKIKAQTSQLDKLNAEIQKGLNLEKRLPELEREIANLESQLNELKAIIPPVRDDSGLLQKIHSLGQRSRLKINKISPQRLRRKEFFDEYPLALDVQGNYHDLAKFFARLANLPRIFNVQNVKLKAPKGSGFTVAANFQAVTFIYREDAKPGAKKASKGKKKKKK